MIVDANAADPSVINGDAVVLLTTSYCHACHAPLTALREMEREIAEVPVVHVQVDKTQNPLRFAKGVGKLKGYPCTMVYRGGAVTQFFFGILDYKDYKNRIRIGLGIAPVA